jgi:hypothetical protein
MPTKILFAIAAAGLASTACVKRHQVSNDELAAEYDSNKYGSDIVTAQQYEEHEDQGASVSVRQMAVIDDTISTVYVKDFERCLEVDMNEFENRWIGGQFSVEFTIEKTGKISSAKILNSDVRERKSPGGGALEGEGRVAAGFNDCVQKALLEWEFDPPDAQFKHTYNGKVGEAW